MTEQQHAKTRQRKSLEKARERLDERKPPPGYPMELGGRTYYLLPPGRDGVRQMEEFILKHRRSPLDIAKAKLDGLTPDQQLALLRDALARESSMPTAITDADFAAALDTREGAAMMFWLMVRKNHPDVALSEIDAIVESATEEEFMQMLAQRDGLVRS